MAHHLSLGPDWSLSYLLAQVARKERAAVLAVARTGDAVIGGLVGETWAVGVQGGSSVRF